MKPRRHSEKAINWTRVAEVAVFVAILAGVHHVAVMIFH